jgi:hypothetical protein
MEARGLSVGAVSSGHEHIDGRAKLSIDGVTLLNRCTARVVHEGDSRMFGLRVEARAEVEFDRTTMVLLISRFSTICVISFLKLRDL